MAGKSPPKPTRRGFLKGAAAAAVVGPTILIRGAGAQGKNPVIGVGEFKYECDHGWGELPDHIKWGNTHGVTIDESGLIYIKHQTLTKEPMDSIVVFDPKGKFVRSWGKEYHGGGHGIDIRKEGGQEFLYLSCTRQQKVVKTTLSGEPVWERKKPEEAGVYDDPKKKFVPTNINFGPDGSFYVGDGYGSSYIHQYDRDAKWVRTWGGVGTEPGKMRTPHGQWLDDRPGRKPSLVIADRANARLQYFTLDGKHLSFVNGLSFPADIDIRGDIMLVPDLHARVSLFDKDNKLITHLGYDPEWTKQVLDRFKMRGQPERWLPGKFIHPHDACFDKDGNIFVVEWVPTGRVTKLRKVS